jgi:glyoxylase-like metal-dependent hydrolase (beta-lactamase superfamily II)
MSANGTLDYDVKVSGLLPAAGEPLPNGERPHWSPLSHTLIHGPTEAALVDPPITIAQTAALANWIEAKGKRLACIYITHWHADHWLGTSGLAARFPGVVVYARQATVRRITESIPGGVPPCGAAS